MQRAGQAGHRQVKDRRVKQRREAGRQAYRQRQPACATPGSTCFAANHTGSAAAVTHHCPVMAEITVEQRSVRADVFDFPERSRVSPSTEARDALG